MYDGCTDANTPFHTWEGARKKVKVLRVVDGDTIDVAMITDKRLQIYKYRVRLYGIDTPEKKPSKQHADREKEIAAAVAASMAMIRKMEENHNYITILFHKKDKYGRELGTLYDEKGVNINEWMIQQGYAIPYDGKKKVPFSERS
jgi:micrococcal nuclease